MEAPDAGVTTGLARGRASCRAVLRRLGRLRERHDPVGAWRLVALLLPACMAWAVESSADVPWYAHPLLTVFAAWLPLLVIAGFATAVVSLDSERRTRRSVRPRPRGTYLLLAMGWATAGVASGLAAWASGARSTGPADWIATGLVWGTMICACATVMMAGCALTVTAPYRWR
jgi:hypothetical protein